MLIKNARQISTEQGDDGFTRNLANEVLSKDDVLFEALGTLDELEAFLGLCFHERPLEILKTIQRALQAISAGIAFDPAARQKAPASWTAFGQADLGIIEAEEQLILDAKPIEAGFSLLGTEDSYAGARFNVARTVCRRAERVFVHFIRQSGRTDLGIALKYLNRLSDLLYVLTKNS